MNTVQTSAIAASFLLAAAFVGWRVHAAHRRPIVQVEIVKDPPRSSTDGCETLVALAESALNLNGVSLNSKLSVLLVGDASTADEPVLLGNYVIPFSTKVIEGRDRNRHRQGDVLNDIWAKCRVARPTNISPIFLAVKQAIADLNARGCKNNGRCQLYVDSDLEENVEPGITDKLNNVNGKARPVPSILDNSNITVTFCGLAATTGRVARNPAREDRISSTWLSLFSARALVTFQPYCPKTNSLGWHERSRTPVS